MQLIKTMTEGIETKIARLMKTSTVFNWARLNKPRFDDTLHEIRKIVDNPPQRSLVPIVNLCTKMANRHLTFDEAFAATSAYQGYLRMAADEIIPILDDYLTRKQIEIVPDFVEKPYQYPFARNADGTVRAIPIKPMFVSIERDRLIPNFVLGWANPKLEFYQIQLICSIIADSLLTQEDYRDGDSKILLIKRGKWGNARSVELIDVKSFSNLDRNELADQFGTYNRAVAQILGELEKLRDI